MDPEIAHDIQTLTKSLHLSNTSLRNRLLSIQHDAEYVTKLHETYFPDLPILANARCGTWYVKPNTSSNDTTYFKSTDGHTNNWSFSTRRLNLHLLETVAVENGAVIVDSTRRGKKIPDSLSKTIAIWAAIINKVITPDVEFSELLQTPRDTVSEYEHGMILDKLPQFYTEFTKFESLLGKNIIEKLDNKRVKLFWVYPGCKNVPMFTGSEDFIPLVLVSASQMKQDGDDKSRGYAYVQGAGDDHELWSRGLTPEIYWDNVSEFACIAEMSDLEVEVVVDNVVNGGSNVNGCSIVINRVSETISFGKVGKNGTMVDEFTQFDKVIVLDSSFIVPIENTKPLIYKFDLESGTKKSSKQLRPLISEIVKIPTSTDKILVLCGTGDDLSVAITICLMNRYKEKLKLSKDTIRSDLIFLMTKFGKLEPQRATLNAINSFLLT